MANIEKMVIDFGKSRHHKDCMEFEIRIWTDDKENNFLRTTKTISKPQLRLENDFQSMFEIVLEDLNYEIRELIKKEKKDG